MPHPSKGPEYELFSQSFMYIKKNNDVTLFFLIYMITNKFRNRIMLNFHKLSITYPVWGNRKSEAYLLFRGGEEEKFKYNF